MRLFVFIICINLLSCSTGFIHRIPSSVKIDYARSDVLYYQEHSKFLANEILNDYEEDKFVIIGWGINSSPAMNEMRKERDSVVELPVARMSEIYKSAKKLKEIEQREVIMTLTYKLFDKILPSMEQVGNKEIVIYRALWTGNTFLEFAAMIIDYYKAKGYTGKIHFNLATDDYTAKNLKDKISQVRSMYGTVPTRLSEFAEDKDYIIRSHVNNKYRDILVNELRDKNYYSQVELENSQSYAEGRLQQARDLEYKTGILDNYLYLQPITAMSIIEDSSFSGFSVNSNFPDKSLEVRLSELDSVDFFLSKESDSFKSRTFLKSYMNSLEFKEDDPRNIDVYLQHIKNIRRDLKDLEEIDFQVFKLIQDHNIVEDILKNINKSVFLTIMRNLIIQSFNKNSEPYKEILAGFLQDFSSYQSYHSIIIKSILTVYKEHDRLDMYVDNWEVFQNAFGLSDQELYDSYFSTDDDRHINYKKFKDIAKKVHNRKWLKERSFNKPNLQIYNSCRDAIFNLFQ